MWKDADEADRSTKYSEHWKLVRETVSLKDETLKITKMSVTVKRQFPKYSQYLPLLDFCFRFSSVIKNMQNLSQFFSYEGNQMNYWDVTLSKKALWSFFCSVLNEESFFCNSSGVFILFIHLQLMFHLKINLVKMKVPMYHLKTLAWQV